MMGVYYPDFPAMTRRSAIVTGATAGFGLAIARALLEAGWAVVGTGRRADRLEELARGSANFHPLAFDVSRRAAVDAAFDSLPPELAQADVLVNNAGLALGLGPAYSADLDDWETMVDTNVKGLLYVTRRVLPGMVRRGRGHVVNIGSVAADNPYPGGNVYGATKAFVWQFTRNLRADLLDTGVRVTDIAPGLAETEFSLVRFAGDRERAARVYAGLEPLTAVDVARATLWAIDQPPHVNINRIELMPTAQAWGALAVDRQP